MRLALPLTPFYRDARLALGIVLPLIRVERLFVFADEPSLLGIDLRAYGTEGDALSPSLSRCFR